MKRFSYLALFCGMLIAILTSPVRAAELVMFEQAACPWCAAFDRDVAPGYAKSEEGLRAPLRRVDVDKALPPDLAFIQVERMTPVFVLVDKGREIGRIRGYPGPEGFWMQISVLFDKLNKAAATGQRADVRQKTLCARG